MLNAIIDGAIRNRLMVVLMLIAIIIGAMMLLPKLNLDAFPDVTNVQVTINTEAKGLAAEEVEQLITYPVEAVMYSLPDVEEVRSISKTGLSLITVVFKEGVDIYFARQLVFEQLQAAREEIPEGVGTPEIGPNTSGLGQMYLYMLRSDDPEQYDIMALRSLNDWVVKLLLMPIDGVTEVLSYGGDVRQYQVNIEPAKLLSYQLRAKDIVEAIERNNSNSGGWYMNRGAEQLIIRGVGWVRGEKDGIRDIENIPVKDEDGVVVRVRDVANVAYGSEIRQGAVSMTLRDENGNPKQLGEVVAGIIMKRIGANTKATIDEVNRRIPIIQNALPEGVTIEPFYDQGSLVDKAVKSVSDALIQAFILIVIILMLFLMNLRAAFLVLISVPISITIALMVMIHWGISANLMSLGGLVIAIGIMVDGAVVVTENIFKHLSQKGDQSHSGGIKLRILEATREVGKPVLFAGLIVIIVFTPLFTLEGVEGKLFKPMAISIVLAMFASLMVALVIVPALATYLFKSSINQKPNKLVEAIEGGYAKALGFVLKGKKIVVIGAITLFIGTMSLVPLLGTEFVPELEEGTVNVRVTLAPSSSMETSLEVANKLERALMEIPEIRYAFSRVGRPELGGDPEPVSNIEIYMGLKPVSEWVSASNRFELQKIMEEKMSVHPGLLFSFSQPIATRVDELLSGVRAQLAIKLFGPDLAVLAEKGKEIENLVNKIEGSQGVAMEQISGEAQLVVRPNRDNLARYGIAVGQVMDLVSDAIGGATAGQVIQGNERYDIYVRYAKEYRKDIDAISDLIMQAPNGSWVRLGDVADVSIEAGPPQIRRDDVQRRVVIQSNLSGRDMGGFVEEIDRRIKEEIDLPPGYSVVFGGQFENQQRAQARLMIVVPLSLGLIFLMLFFTFGSVKQSALIMLNVPLAIIGGVIALYISGLYLSVPGSIGFIALSGIAVLNGVVMINAINVLIESGTEARKAVFEGALSRLRPVLMTAATTTLGLIPILLSTGIGSEVQRPLATVVVGGMFSSTLLTLFVLPVLYSTFSQRIINERR